MNSPQYPTIVKVYAAVNVVAVVLSFLYFQPLAWVLAGLSAKVAYDYRFGQQAQLKEVEVSETAG